MWYPEILNRMAHFVNKNPGKDVSVCAAIYYYEQEYYSMPFINNTENIMVRNFIINNVIICKTLIFQRQTSIPACKDNVNNEVFLITLIIGFCFAILYILIGTFINIIGNRNILVGFFVITTTFGLASQYVDGIMLAQLFMGIFLMEATCIGVINTIVIDLYPTQMRGMALAISLMAGRFGAVTGSHLTGPLIYNYCEFTFYVFSIDHISK